LHITKSTLVLRELRNSTEFALTRIIPDPISKSLIRLFPQRGLKRRGLANPEKVGHAVLSWSLPGRCCYIVIQFPYNINALV